MTRCGKTVNRYFPVLDYLLCLSAWGLLLHCTDCWPFPNWQPSQLQWPGVVRSQQVFSSPRASVVSVSVGTLIALHRLLAISQLTTITIAMTRCGKTLNRYFPVLEHLLCLSAWGLLLHCTDCWPFPNWQPSQLQWPGVVRSQQVFSSPRASVVSVSMGTLIALHRLLAISPLTTITIAMTRCGKKSTGIFQS